MEYVYSLMAGDAGIMVPETHLFAGRKQKGCYFGSKV